MSTRATKPVPMCCVQIGYESYLLPSDKGMKVVELMQSAFTCERNYGPTGFTYQAVEQPNVEFALVRANQVVAPKGDSKCAPLALER